MNKRYRLRVTDILRGGISLAMEHDFNALSIAIVCNLDADYVLKRAKEKSLRSPYSALAILKEWKEIAYMGRIPDELSGIINGEIRNADDPQLESGK